jgi:exosortase
MPKLVSSAQPEMETPFVRLVRFAVLFVLATVVLWQPFAATMALALRDDQYTHILLILPVSVALISSEWHSLRLHSSSSPLAAACLFAAGILIAAWAKWSSAPTPDVRLALGMLSLVILWNAAFIFFFGVSAARSAVFSLGFLFWMVPLPAFLLDRIVHWLQQWSSVAAWLLFSASGVPASHDGILISIPGLTVEVAQECSSIRSSLMLLVTTMVLAHVLLRSSWRKFLLVSIAVPLSVAKNGLRIFTIAILGTRVDRGFLTGRLHREGGSLFFLLALLGISFFLWFLRRSERAQAYS